MHMLVQNLGNSLMKSETGAIQGGQGEKGKREAGHSRSAGGCVNKQGNLQGFVLGSHNRSRSLPLPTKILKAYVEIVTGSVMYIVQMVSTTSLLWQDCPWDSFWYGEGKWNVHSKDRGEGEEPLIAQVLLKGHVLLVTSSNSPHDWLLDSYMHPRCPFLQCAPSKGFHQHGSGSLAAVRLH